MKLVWRSEYYISNTQCIKNPVHFYSVDSSMLAIWDRFSKMPPRTSRSSTYFGIPTSAEFGRPPYSLRFSKKHSILQARRWRVAASIVSEVRVYLCLRECSRLSVVPLRLLNRDWVTSMRTFSGDCNSAGGAGIDFIAFELRLLVSSGDIGNGKRCGSGSHVKLIAKLRWYCRDWSGRLEWS